MADPVWLPEVLTKAGVKTATLNGAFERGHGDMWDIQGLMNHHTGASEAPGPWAIAQHPSLGLCSQIHLARNGVATVCGVGIAWHGGSGGGYGWIRDVNAQLIGMEMENNGTEGWGASQYWACVTINAAVDLKIGRDQSRSIGHKEWAGAAQGKWDPGGMNMTKLRDDIGHKIRELKGAKPIVVENQINRIAGFSPWLGKRIDAAERSTRNKSGGRFVRFENGVVYWSPKTGAIPVPNHVLEVYARHDYEAGFLGLPKRFHVVASTEAPDGTRVDVGDIQAFEGGIVYRKYGTPGAVVHGRIGDRWFTQEQAERGAFGWPTSEEYGHGELIVQDFEHGSIAFDPDGTFVLDRGDRLYVPPGR